MGPGNDQVGWQGTGTSAGIKPRRGKAARRGGIWARERRKPGSPASTEEAASMT
jgi:hypothetical protein